MKIKHLWVYIETQWEVTSESHELDNYTLSLKLYRIPMQLANPQQIPTLCREMGRNKGFVFKLQHCGAVWRLSAAKEHTKHTGRWPESNWRTSSPRGLPEIGRAEGNFRKKGSCSLAGQTRADSAVETCCEWWYPLWESSRCEEVWAMGTASSAEDCLNITKDSGTGGMARSVNVRGLEFGPQSPCKNA